MPQDEFAYVHALFSFIEVFMLVSWLTFRAGISLPIIGGIGNMLTSFEYLLIARYRIFRGLQSNLWEQHEAPRIQMSKFSELKKAPPRAETSGGAVIFAEYIIS